VVPENEEPVRCDATLTLVGQTQRKEGKNLRGCPKKRKKQAEISHEGVPACLWCGVTVGGAGSDGRSPSWSISFLVEVAKHKQKKEWEPETTLMDVKPELGRPEEREGKMMSEV
jgi:hypothetical protein